MIGYACLRCQLRRLRQRRSHTPLSSAGNLQALRAPLRWSDQRARLYATATESLHDETYPESAKGAAFPYDAFDHSLNSPSFGRGPVLQTENTLRGTPSIRDHLRAWGSERSRLDRLEAGDSIPERGRIRVLPNSLFLEEQTEATGEEKEDDAEAEDFAEMTEGEHRNAMKPGDLCYIHPALSKRQFAVFVGQAGVQLLYVLESGKFTQMDMATEAIATEPGFITEDEAETIRAGLPKQHIVRSAQGDRLTNFGEYLGDPPESVGALCENLAKRLRDFRNEVVRFRRSHVKLLDTLYERIAQEDDYVCVPLREFYEGVTGSQDAEISAAGRMAIFLMTMTSPTKIHLWYGRQNTRIWALLVPKRLARKLSDVVDWAREYQELAALASKGQNVQSLLRKNPVNQFINKARAVITESRKLRSPTTIGCLGPSKQSENTDGTITKRTTSTSFSESDIAIIDFIHDTYVREPRIKMSTVHHAIASLILRGIGAYPKMSLEKTIGRLLLQELGVLKPWADGVEDNVVLPLPGQRGAEKLTRLYAEAERAATSLGFKADSEDLPIPDPFEDARTDLGDMPVYVIDAVETDVRDDGVSFEDSKEHPGCYWVHVHVAHPSAFLGPDSVFGQVARTQCHSWYTKAKTYHMLPYAVSTTLSLKAGSPTLTTSTLLDEDGKVVDIRIRPTRIHNVIYLQPQGVDELLGLSETHQTTLIVGVDPTIPVETPRSKIDEEIAMARPHMPVLAAALKRLRIRQTMRLREQKETVDFEYHDAEPQVDVNEQQAFQPSDPYEIVHYVGDPTIRLRSRTVPWVGKWSDIANAQWNLVQHCMVLAGESTAKWLADRRIPAVFAGSLADPEFPISKLNTATKFEHFLTPKAVSRAEPVPHVIMAVSQYVKSTSPLRRVDDLITQWNIDSYLLAETQGVVHNGSPLPASYDIPFPAPAIMDHLRVNGWTTYASANSKKTTERHWAFQALFRAFHFKEAELPEIWYMQARSTRLVSVDIHPDGSTVAGLLAPFGHSCILLASEDRWESMASRNHYLPVKIEKVDAINLSVYARAVGPPVDEKPPQDLSRKLYYASKERRAAIERAEKEEADAAQLKLAA